MTLFQITVRSLAPSGYTESAFQVAKAFWTAIGGDDDEIDGLSSGEES